MRLVAYALITWAIAASFGCPASAQVQPAKPDESMPKAQIYPRVNAHRPTKEDFEPYDRADKPLGDARKRAERLIQTGKLVAAERVMIDAMAAAREDRFASPDLLLPTLADVYLQEGRNREALTALLEFCRARTRSADLDLNICIAFCSLGDYQEALPYYTEATTLNASIWGFDPAGQPLRLQGWPGTRSLAQLEASPVLARGITKRYTGNWADAQGDFQAAGRLARGNPLISYHEASALIDLKRHREAIPSFQRAVNSSNRSVAEDTCRRLAGLRRLLSKPHPTARGPERD